MNIKQIKKSIWFVIPVVYLTHVNIIFSRAIFEVIMPLEDGNGGPLVFELPVTYDIDSGQ